VATLGKIKNDNDYKILDHCSGCGRFIVFETPDYILPEELDAYKLSKKKCCKCVNDENKMEP